MTRKTVGIRDFKNEATRILSDVRESKTEYIVTKHGEPVAVLRPWDEDDQRQRRHQAAARSLARLQRTAREVAKAAGATDAAVAVSQQRR